MSDQYETLPMFGGQVVTQTIGYVNERRLETWALSDREKDICRCAARGMTPKQMGHQLHIARSTVNSHLQRIYLKANIDGLADLAILTVRPDGEPRDHGLRLVS